MSVERQVVGGLPLFLAAGAGLYLVSCGALGTHSSPAAADALPALASADPLSGGPLLVLDPDNDRPAPLAGTWNVATGNRNCTLELRVEDAGVTGHALGCSADEIRLPIAIGIVSGSSFLFQTGHAGEGSIWSGRYDSETQTLQGRRENVVTGKLESFVARR